MDKQQQIIANYMKSIRHNELAKEVAHERHINELRRQERAWDISQNRKLEDYAG